MNIAMPSTGRRAILAAIILVILGRIAADLTDVLPGPFTRSRSAAAAPTPSSPPPKVLGAKPAPTLAAAAGSVTPGGVAEQLSSVLRQSALGDDLGVYIVNPSSDTKLLDKSSEKGFTPASTLKILTICAALAATGGDGALKTRVVQGNGPAEVVLVGEGDVLLGVGASNPDQVLGHAGLATLAAATAKKMPDQTGKITVIFDDSKFSGPSMSPGWQASYRTRGIVTPISALGLAENRAKLNEAGPADPSASAAAAFAKALQKELKLRELPRVVRGRAAADAEPLAEVNSAPIRQIAELALTDSDNSLAEVLGRLTALATDRPASFTGASEAVLAQLTELGLDLGGAELADTSGLAPGSTISPRLLVDTLTLAAREDKPELRALLTGLPIAGLTGTLAPRFAEPETDGARGVVRAKTGTLSSVVSLAGQVVDADGHLMMFAILLNGVPDLENAKLALDRVASALAQCGCE